MPTAQAMQWQVLLVILLKALSLERVPGEVDPAVRLWVGGLWWGLPPDLRLVHVVRLLWGGDLWGGCLLSDHLAQTFGPCNSTPSPRLPPC